MCCFCPVLNCNYPGCWTGVLWYEIPAFPPSEASLAAMENYSETQKLGGIERVAKEKDALWTQWRSVLGQMPFHTENVSGV